MLTLSLPRNLRENNHIKNLAYKTGEPIELAMGRLLFLIDYATSVGEEEFSHRQIEEHAGWTRTDLRYAEALEFAGFGELIKGGIKLRFPKGFPNKMRFVIAGKARAAKAKRVNGKYAGGEARSVTSVVDAEGNQRPVVESPKKQAKRSESASISPAKDAGVSLVNSTPSLSLSPSLPPLCPPSSPLSDSPPSIPPIIPPSYPQTLSLTPSPGSANLPPRGDQQPRGVDGFSKSKKPVSENAISERRELNKFWRERYEHKFGHPYPRPADARYNAEIKKIHEALGLAGAKEKLTWYLAWNDAWIVGEGHPIELFLMKLVKMESDRARAESKLKTAANTKVMKEAIVKQDKQQLEVELAYAKITAERNAARETNTSGLQQGDKSIPVLPETRIHRKPSDQTE